jgi:gas vesicle protein|tara:strand:+ start:363 stop:497 length:135 start_codon:yes stop_codon:yes gene_type:complete
MVLVWFLFGCSAGAVVGFLAAALVIIPKKTDGRTDEERGWHDKP